MNRFKLLFSIFAIVFLFTQMSGAQNKLDQQLLNQAEKITNDKFSFETKTSKGARVFSVKKPSSQMLKSIDKGLTDLFALAQKNRYSKRLNYSDYTIFIAKADRTYDDIKQYSPDIVIGAAQYAGSIYDHGGYVYAAGMVVSYNPCAFIIAEHTKDFQRVSNVVSYEGEHIVLYHNDRQRYNQTADHSKGGGHPILQ